MAKMKSVPSSSNYQALIGLTDKVHFRALVTLISFLNAMSSNFLDGFFMRPTIRHGQGVLRLTSFRNGCFIRPGN